MKGKNTLSIRGKKAATSVLRIDFELYFEASKNIYDKEKNPNGTFPLNTAENKLSWPILKDKLELIALEKSIPDWVTCYTSCLGSESFRRVLADFLSNFLTKCPINLDHIGLSSGATGVIEMTSFLLGDKGDVVVFPAPCYPVYKQDMGNKAGLERYDLVTHHEIKDIYNKPALKVKHLKKAKNEIEKKGKNFRILVITNPDNPTGGLYPKKKLKAISDWCIKNRIHLAVNEIYALSLINTKHPDIKEDYPKKRKFVSFVQIIQAKKSPYLHLWYSLSKDIGVSGFRVGMVYSHNKAFLKAYDNYNAPHLISNHTQWLFEELLSDPVFMDDYIKNNQYLLTEAYVVIIKQLRKLKIPYVPSRGSLFIWADFSEFLKKQTQKAETKFWEDLYAKTGILLTPGQGFGHSKKGLFRIVYPCFFIEGLVVAMKRLEKYILEIRMRT